MSWQAVRLTGRGVGAERCPGPGGLQAQCVVPGPGLRVRIRRRAAGRCRDAPCGWRRARPEGALGGGRRRLVDWWSRRTRSTPASRSGSRWTGVCSRPCTSAREAVELHFVPSQTDDFFSNYFVALRSNSYRWAWPMRFRHTLKASTSRECRPWLGQHQANPALGRRRCARPPRAGWAFSFQQ